MDPWLHVTKTFRVPGSFWLALCGLGILLLLPHSHAITLPIPASALVILASTALSSTALWGVRKSFERHRTGSNSSLSAQQHAHEGLALFKVANYRLALWHLRHALVLEPLDPYSRLLLGRCHHEIGHLRWALRNYRAAHRQFRDLSNDLERASEAAYNASLTLALRGRADAALHWLNLAIQHDPAYALLARAEGDFAEISQHPTYQALINGPLGVRSNLIGP